MYVIILTRTFLTTRLWRVHDINFAHAPLSVSRKEHWLPVNMTSHGQNTLWWSRALHALVSRAATVYLNNERQLFCPSKVVKDCQRRLSKIKQRHKSFSKSILSIIRYFYWAKSIYIFLLRRGWISSGVLIISFLSAESFKFVFEWT